jgi:hypothetical protein
MGRCTPLPALAAAIELPAPDAAVVMEVPDNNWQGWGWPSGDAVLLHAQIRTVGPGNT